MKLYSSKLKKCLIFFFEKTSDILGSNLKSLKKKNFLCFRKSICEVSTAAIENLCEVSTAARENRCEVNTAATYQKN